MNAIPKHLRGLFSPIFCMSGEYPKLGVFSVNSIQFNSITLFKHGKFIYLSIYMYGLKSRKYR